MSVTPDDFLDSAASLAVRGCNEMVQRNVISRAYYAAYHRSCAFIKPLPEYNGKGMHRGYINYLLCGDKSSVERQIGGRLKALYARRLIADYQLNTDLNKNDYDIQIQTATDLFRIVLRAESML